MDNLSKQFKNQKEKGKKHFLMQIIKYQFFSPKQYSHLGKKKSSQK